MFRHVHDTLPHTQFIAAVHRCAGWQKNTNNVCETPNERLSPSRTCALCRAHTHIIDTVLHVEQSFRPGPHTFISQSTKPTGFMTSMLLFCPCRTRTQLAQQFTFIRCARICKWGGRPLRTSERHHSRRILVYNCFTCICDTVSRVRRARALTPRFNDCALCVYVIRR